MDRVMVDLVHSRALQLLQDLESMHIIKMHHPKEETKIKLSEKYKGILSKEDGKDLNNHIEQMRSEWNNSL